MTDGHTYETWSMEYLPMVQRIMNAQEHYTTGVSPAELLFGKAITSYDRLIWPKLDTTGDVAQTSRQLNLATYTADMLVRQTTLMQIAYENQRDHDLYHISCQENDDQLTNFPINSYVLYTAPGQRRHKLQPARAGPYYRVVHSDGSVYTIQDLMSLKLTTTHISQLTAFEFDETRTSPETVAMHNQNLYIPIAILRHRGQKARKKTLEFEVQWEGIDQPTWEPWQNLRHLELLHVYLRDHGMKTLIPKKTDVEHRPRKKRNRGGPE